MALRQALDAYEALGFEVVSSSALINQTHRVRQMPDESASIQQQIQFLLAEHGLVLNIVRPGYGYALRNEKRVDEAPVTKTPRETSRVRTEQVKPIEEVFVSSTYRLGVAEEGVRYMDQRELENLPSAGRDTLRAISTLPGVASSGVSANLRLRGGDQNEVLYLLDGQQIVEPFHLKNFQSLFSVVNPNVVASANVYASGFSVSQGSRMSGVVSLDLPSSESNQHWPKTNGSLDVNLISAAVDGRGRVGELNWLVSARRSVVEAAIAQLDSDFGRPQFHDELLRLHWKDEKNSLRFGLLNFADKIGLLDEDSFEMGSSNFKYTSSWLHWQREFSQNNSLELKLSHIDADADRSGQLRNSLDAIGSIRQSSSYNVSILSVNGVSWYLDSTEFLWGGEVQRQAGEFNNDNRAVFGQLGNELGKIEQRIASQQNRDGLIATAYFSAATQFADRWHATAGLRYALQDIDPVHEEVLSFRARLAFSVNPTTHVFMDAGRYAQAQNLYELQLDDGKVELDPPQFSDQVSIGFSKSFGSGVLFRLDAYARNIKNPWSRFDNIYNRWVLLPELHADRIEIQASKARVRGMDLSFRHRFSEAVSAEASYSYSSAEDKVRGVWVSRPWNQPHSAKLGLRWESGAWTVSGFASYHTGWPLTGRGDTAQGSAIQLYTEKAPDFFTLDLHLARNFVTHRGELLLYADILNSTNRRNVGGYRYESIAGDLRRDARHLFPLVPVLGLRWKW